MYRYLSSRQWSSKIGSFNPSLSKGPTSTTWIWNLHATPHDFANGSITSIDISRKVIASSAAHFSIILVWVSGMLFHGSYFSNYVEWLRDPLHIKPSAHLVWSVVGQDILNSDVGRYFQGLYISSGLFHMWKAQGMASHAHLKCASLVSLITSLSLLGLAFYTMHVWPIKSTSRPLSYRNSTILSGLASISWCAHIVHISIPMNTILGSGVDPTLLINTQDLLSRNLLRKIVPRFGTTSLTPSNNNSHSIVSETIYGYVELYGCLPLPVVAAHHLYLGVAPIVAGLLVQPQTHSSSSFTETSSSTASYWHSQLSSALLISSTLSLIHAHNVYSSISYPYLGCDYITQTSLYCHHM